MQLEPPVLDAALLGEYEARLRDQGVPLENWGHAGITPEQQHRALRALGLRLPGEAQTWWSWHNGCPGYGLAKLATPIGEKLLNIDEAVDVYREYRDIVVRHAEPDIPELANPDDRWSPSWLPITGRQTPIVIDCSEPETDVTRLRCINLAYVTESKEIGAQSLGQMVIWWIGAIDSGAWVWDRSAEQWIVDAHRLDSAFKMSALA
jgi:hypothetical protein